MKILWAKSFGKKISRNWVFQNSPESEKKLQETTEIFSSEIDSLKSLITQKTAEQTDEQINEKELIQDFFKGDAREKFANSLSKNNDFFGNGDIGKEKYLSYTKLFLSDFNISETEKTALLNSLYIDAMLKNNENLDKSTEDFSNRTEIHNSMWKDFGAVISAMDNPESEQESIMDQVKNFLIGNQNLLSESEQKSLNDNPKNFWENKGAHLKKLVQKFANRPKKLAEKEALADAAFEQKLTELSQDKKFKSWSEETLLKKFEDTDKGINLSRLPDFLGEEMTKKFEEKKGEIIKKAKTEQLKILAEKEKEFLEKNEKLLDKEFTNFSEKKGILKINFEDFSPHFDEIQKEKIKLKNVPRSFGEKMVEKFAKQKEAFAAKLETAKERVNKGEKIIMAAKDRAESGDWKNLTSEEIYKKTNDELSQQNIFADMPKSIQKLLGERLKYLWTKVEGDIKNRENKESNDKIPRTEMAAAWNKMSANLQNYEQNFSSKSKLKAFFISEYFGDREADAKAYLKNHPNFAKAIEAKFASYSAEKKEADSAQNKEFETTISSVSNKTIQKAMQKSFASSTSFKEKQGWIKGLKDTYVPRYEKSLSNLRDIRDTIDGKKGTLKHSTKAQEIFATITSKKNKAQESWKNFDGNFFSPKELEDSLVSDLAQLKTVEADWSKKNIDAKSDIANMNLDDVIKNASEKDLARMKKDPSFLAKQFDVWMDDDVWQANEPEFKQKLLSLHSQLNNPTDTAEKSETGLDAAMEQKIANMSAEKIDPTKITSAGAFAKALGESHGIKTSPAQWENGGKEAFTTKFNELWPQHQERIKLAKTMTQTINNMDADWLKKKGADSIQTRQDFDRALGNKNKVLMPEADWNQWGADKFYAKADELSDDFSAWQKENGEVGVNDLRDLGYGHQLDFKNVILKNTDNLNNKFDRLKTVLDSGKGTEKLLKGNEKETLPFLLEMLDTISAADFDQLQKDLNNKDKPDQIAAILTKDNSRNVKVKKLMTTHVEEWNNFAGSQTSIANNLLGIEDDLDESLEDDQVLEDFDSPVDFEETDSDNEEINEDANDEDLEDDTALENFDSPVDLEETDSNNEEIDEDANDEDLEDDTALENFDSPVDLEETDSNNEEINEDANDEDLEDNTALENFDSPVDLEELDTETINKETLAETKEHEELDAEAAETEMQDMLANFLKKLNQKESEKENTNIVQEKKESKVHFTEKHVSNGMRFGDLISKSILFYEMETRTEIIRNVQLTDEQKQISIENAAEVFDAISDKLFELTNLTFLAIRMKKQSKNKIVLDLAGHLNEGTFTEELALKVKINK